MLYSRAHHWARFSESLADKWLGRDIFLHPSLVLMSISPTRSHFLVVSSFTHPADIEIMWALPVQELFSCPQNIPKPSVILGWIDHWNDREQLITAAAELKKNKRETLAVISLMKCLAYSASDGKTAEILKEIFLLTKLYPSPLPEVLEIVARPIETIKQKVMENISSFPLHSPQGFHQIKAEDLCLTSRYIAEEEKEQLNNLGWEVKIKVLRGIFVINLFIYLSISPIDITQLGILFISSISFVVGL